MPVDGVLEYLWFRDNDPWWATLLRAVELLILVFLIAFTLVHKVPSGSKAIRMRFNKVVHYRRDIYDRLGYRRYYRGDAKIVGPGLVIGIPFVHTFLSETVTEQFEPLPPMIRLQPYREFTSAIHFQMVDLEKALLGVGDYKGLLVMSCAEEVRRIVKQTSLSDDDISARLLADESMQQRASHLGVRLLHLTVSSSNLFAPAQLVPASSNIKGEISQGPPPAAALPAGTVNGASDVAPSTGVGNSAPTTNAARSSGPIISDGT
jgi:hypothetical protein